MDRLLAGEDVGKTRRTRGLPPGRFIQAAIDLDGLVYMVGRVMGDLILRTREFPLLSVR